MPIIDQSAKKAAILVNFEYGDADFSRYLRLDSFVEVDPSAMLAVSPILITFTDLSRGVSAYVYKDFGVGFFDFSVALKHRFQISHTDLGNKQARVFHWVLSNDILDWKALVDGNKDAWAFDWYGGNTTPVRLTLRELNGGVVTQDTFDVTSYGSNWIEVEYDPTVGANGTLYARIYSDEYETLLDTLTVTLTQQVSFRYFFPINSFNDGQGTTDYQASGSVSNFDLAPDVELESGEQEVRYTDWTTDLEHPVEKKIHTSVPSMDIQLPKYTGVLKEKVLRITLPIEEDTFVSRIANGELFPVTQVTVNEYYCDETGTAGDFFTLFKGQVRKTIRNAQGRPNRVRFECENEKAKLVGTLGMLSTHHCIWELGDFNCDPTQTVIQINTLREWGFVSNVSGTLITIIGLPAKASRYWQAGFVEFNGLRIKIRDWESGTIFKLTRPVPEEWLSRSVRLTPGCDKTKETCENTWSNLPNFNGNGYGIPRYHPVIEIPS